MLQCLKPLGNVLAHIRTLNLLITYKMKIKTHKKMVSQQNLEKQLTAKIPRK